MEMPDKDERDKCVVKELVTFKNIKYDILSREYGVRWYYNPHPYIAMKSKANGVKHTRLNMHKFEQEGWATQLLDIKGAFLNG
eukprot:11310111-Ditylum_brightwellii.AAC.1